MKSKPSLWCFVCLCLNRCDAIRFINIIIEAIYMHIAHWLPLTSHSVEVSRQTSHSEHEMRQNPQKTSAHSSYIYFLRCLFQFHLNILRIRSTLFLCMYQVQVQITYECFEVLFSHPALLFFLSQWKQRPFELLFCINLCARLISIRFNL